jgi:hypothetical protein
MATRSQLLGLRGEWLLDLVVAGQVYRFGTTPAEVEDIDGITYTYVEGLQDLSQSVGSSGTPDSSVDIEIDASTAWADFVGNFATIERSRCTIRRWFPGQTLEAARVVLEGELQGFSYGEENEPISFSVVRSIRRQSRLLPTAGMVVDSETWPVRGAWVIDERVRGTYYPIVIGAPGAGSTPSPATEALIVETDGADNTDKLLIAGHEVLASSVVVYDYTDEVAPVSATLTVTTTTDGAGRKVAIVEPALALGGVAVTPGRVYYVGWGTSNLGIRNPRTGAGLRGAADVIEWLLSTWTDVAVDAARFAGVRARLNQYKIDTYINTPIDPEEWLNAEVLPLLPVEARQGERGLYFYVHPTDVDARHVATRLDADTGQIQRVSTITSSSDSLVNEVTVEYRPDRATGAFRSRVTLSATDGLRTDELAPDLTDARVRGSYRARLSQARYGRLPLTIQAHAVSDPATAVRIGQDVIARQALPRRLVEYEGGPELESLDVGQVVRLNDSRVGFADELAVLLDIRIEGSRVVLPFELLDDPVLLQRVVA